MPLPRQIGRYRRGTQAGQLFVFAGRKMIPLEQYTKYTGKQFKISDIGALTFTFTVPQWLGKEIPKSSYVFVKTLPTTIFGAHRPDSEFGEDILTPEGMSRKMQRALMDATDSGAIAGQFMDSAIEDIDTTARNVTENLKQAFRSNLQKAMNKKISPIRSIRRNLFNRLSTSRGYGEQLSGEDPYDENEFNQAIDGFKFERDNQQTESKIRIMFKIPESTGKPHPDFGGGPSGFIGRDQIVLSILGVRFRAGERTPTQSNYMIVPAEFANPINVYYRYKGNKTLIGVKRSMALVTSSGKFVSPKVQRFGGVKAERTEYEKKQLSAQSTEEGIPVNFLPSISGTENFIENPDPHHAESRTVFWGQIENTLFLPENVKTVLRDAGMLRRDIA